MSNAKITGKRVHLGMEAGLINNPISYDKSVFSGMDFGELERKVILMSKMGKSILTEYTGRTNDQEDAFVNIMNMLEKDPQLWPYDYYASPPPIPQLHNEIFSIIDNFWENPCIGLVPMYLKQIEKNPKTKDLFKGVSTTHHYPWYKRGSKY